MVLLAAALLAAAGVALLVYATGADLAALHRCPTRCSVPTTPGSLPGLTGGTTMDPIFTLMDLAERQPDQAQLRAHAQAFIAERRAQRVRRARRTWLLLLGLVLAVVAAAVLL